MSGKFDYKPVKDLIEAGMIDGFKAIFNFYGIRTALANDAGINYTRFKTIIEKCDLFTGVEIYQIARVIGVQGKVLAHLWIDQIEKDKAKIRKHK
jgi:hypothetical protein